jgi:hypothetical protein
VTTTPSAPAKASTPIAGLRFLESQIQKAASPISTVRPARIAAMPQPVGSQKIAATIANARSSCYTITTGTPTFTWSKSQVASEMCMRMQPCEAE